MARLTFSSLTFLPAFVLVASSAAGQATRTPDVHFVPTPMDVVDTMLSVAKVMKNDRLFDLGSGDGRIVITAAKRFGTRGIGIDIDPQRITESRRNADTAGVTQLVEFRQADLFQTDLRNATVITLYLLPRLNVQLRPKLFEELRPGSRIVSHAFDMGDWPADSTINVGGRTVYYWLMPANVAGTWSLSTTGGAANRSYDLQLQQTYQRMIGTATAGGRTMQVEAGRIIGDSVTFMLVDSGGSGGQQRMQFAGRLANGTLSGTVAGTQSRWRATRRTR
jgi:hypothetical protein